MLLVFGERQANWQFAKDSIHGEILAPPTALRRSPVLYRR
jgi:hypothetical protein